MDLSSDAFFDMAKREVPDYGREFSEEQIEECTATYLSLIHISRFSGSVCSFNSIW